MATIASSLPPFHFIVCEREWWCRSTDEHQWTCVHHVWAPTNAAQRDWASCNRDKACGFRTNAATEPPLDQFWSYCCRRWAQLSVSWLKATITHWRFLLENRRDTANLRTADERHKIWRFCFHFHGITVVVRQDTLSCAHLRQQYGQDWSSGGSVAALVRKPHALSRLHDA